MSEREQGVGLVFVGAVLGALLLGGMASTNKWQIDPARLTPEECGYYDEHGAVISDARSILESAYEAFYDTVKHTAVGRTLNGPLSIDSNGKISVEIGISTPLGDFRVVRNMPQGVRTLILRVNGRQRFFRIDRPAQILTADDGLAVREVNVIERNKCLSLEIVAETEGDGTTG